MDSPNTSQGLHLFSENSHLRSSWIAFFTLWVLWGLSYFLRHVTGQNNDETRGTATTAQQDTEAGTADKKKGWKNMHNSLSDRLKRSHEVLLENTLLLLSVLTLNTFSGGTTRAVMILCWIFFAFTITHALTEVGINHHFIRLAFNIIFYGVTLAIGGLSFSHES